MTGSEDRRWGDFRVVRLIGKGGMSEVYEVEHVRLGSRHALKLFAYEKDDPEVRRRFETEGRLLARLSHPRIVRVTDIGTEAETGRPYFVMDLIRDERGQQRSLADVAPGTADEETVGRWYDDLREGLAYIHANGVIHRDLKLQNVLVGPDGHVVLADFGISKIFAAEGAAAVVDTVQTIVKVRDGRSLVMGSPGYMAPELEMGVAASRESDWYALGVIVYRLLTGTWCDARTDVVGALDSYEAAWSRILPKLLHANPQGRECLSFAAERAADRERLACAAEIRGEELGLALGRLTGQRRILAAVIGVLLLACLGLVAAYASAGASRREAEELCRQQEAAVRKLVDNPPKDDFGDIEGVRLHEALRDLVQ
ncbi:MAG: serine/threonine-protein kinase [Kiritimatiellia bacterium]